MIHTALCDQCDCRIIGARYKCCMCTDFDLCEKCERIHNHDTTHVFLKASFSIRSGPPRSFKLPNLYHELPDTPLKQFYHKGHTCNLCKNVIFGPRFVCMDCSGPVNLCQSCEMFDKHSEYHVVLKLIYPLPINCSFPSFLDNFAKTDQAAMDIPSTIKYLPPRPSPSFMFPPNKSTPMPIRFLPLPPALLPPPSIKINHYKQLYPSTTITTQSYSEISSSPPLVSFSTFYIPPRVGKYAVRKERTWRREKRCNTNKGIVVRAMRKEDIEPVMVLDVECFPLSPMAYSYFLNVLIHPMKSAFVAEDTHNLCLVGYPILCPSHILLHILTLTVEKYISCSYKQLKSKTHIESIAVSPKCRRQKIGDKLLSCCLSLLFSHRKVISLHVRKDNEAAIALYKKYGFQIYNEIPGYYVYEEAQCKHSGDAYTMRLSPSIM